MSTDVVTMMRQFVCGLSGHENLLHFGRGHLSLKCMSCGYESPGWDIKTRGENTPETAAPALPSRLRRLLQHAHVARRVLEVGKWLALGRALPVPVLLQHSASGELQRPKKNRRYRSA